MNKEDKIDRQELIDALKNRAELYRISFAADRETIANELDFLADKVRNGLFPYPKELRTAWNEKNNIK